MLSLGSELSGVKHCGERVFGHFEPVIPAFAEVQPWLADGRSERVAATSAGDEVCLRGGTVLNLGFLNLPRLSVDVDLDDVGSTDSADARRRRPELLRELTALAESLGYAEAEERRSHAMAPSAWAIRTAAAGRLRSK